MPDFMVIGGDGAMRCAGLRAGLSQSRGAAGEGVVFSVRSLSTNSRMYLTRPAEVRRADRYLFGLLPLWLSQPWLSRACSASAAFRSFSASSSRRGGWRWFMRIALRSLSSRIP